MFVLLREEVKKKSCLTTYLFHKVNQCTIYVFSNVYWANDILCYQPGSPRAVVQVDVQKWIA